MRKRVSFIKGVHQNEYFEKLQTEHSEDEYFYRCTQKEMDALDEQAEHIRGVLEGRWDE